MKIKLLFLLALLQGCAAGYVKGDLSGHDFKNKRVPYCSTESEKQFQIKIETDASNDYGENLLAMISILSLGIIPTYSFSFDETNVSVQNFGTEIYKETYDSTGHKFFGWLWLALPESENSVNVDEGAGIRIRDAVLAKAALKAVEELSVDLDHSCFTEVRS